MIAATDHPRVGRSRMKLRDLPERVLERVNQIWPQVLAQRVADLEEAAE
jgi:hypothetical protein